MLFVRLFLKRGSNVLINILKLSFTSSQYTLNKSLFCMLLINNFKLSNDNTSLYEKIFFEGLYDVSLFGEIRDNNMGK